eukprot:3755739-Alexandrium_andersonii.AAC.1
MTPPCVPEPLPVATAGVQTDFQPKDCSLAVWEPGEETWVSASMTMSDSVDPRKSLALGPYAVQFAKCTRHHG